MRSPEHMCEVTSLLEHFGSSDWCGELLFAEMMKSLKNFCIVIRPFLVRHIESADWTSQFLRKDSWISRSSLSM